MRAFRLLAVSGLFAALASSAAAQGLKVNKATYMVLPNGPGCDATPMVAPKCDGKDGCQIKVDPPNMCADPAPDKWKSAIVTYTCNGRTETLSFPDGAQLALRCLGGSSGGSGTTATPPPPPRPIPPVVTEEAWRVDNDPNEWILRSDGTAQAKNGYWHGTWRRTQTALLLTYWVGPTGPHQTMSIVVSRDGKSFTAYESGQAVHRGVRVR